jgi:hypothetical protein
VGCFDVVKSFPRPKSVASLVRRLSWTLLAVPLAGLGGPVAAAGQTTSSGPAEPYRSMGLNGDGLVTRAELQRLNSDPKAWAQLDVDANGVLDAEEEAAAPKPGYVIRN